MRRLAIILLVMAGLVTACSNNVFDLEVGQCFDDPEDLTEVGNVEIVDCADPHDNEVYHVFDIPGGDDAPYPGSLSVSTSADDGCLAAFPGFVGIDYNSSRYVVSSLQPSEQSWNDIDDREVVCFLFDIDLAKLTGSARNTAE